MKSIMESESTVITLLFDIVTFVFLYRDMWSYLEHVGLLLEKLVNFYQSVPIEERASIGQELVSRPSGRKSTHSSKLIARTMSVHMAEITGISMDTFIISISSQCIEFNAAGV